ncbi:hypothetical protein M885DRAFT_532473 [Pelagophyceae sp. CCMP2097]|nr:hypothetical protein M885DRAFT_532473 [Pelagophyceae sp. CCMP2097]
MRLQEEVIALRSALAVERRGTVAACHAARADAERRNASLRKELVHLQAAVSTSKAQLVDLAGRSAEQLDATIQTLVPPPHDAAITEELQRERDCAARLRRRLQDHEVYRQVTESALARSKTELEKLAEERDAALHELKRLRRLYREKCDAERKVRAAADGPSADSTSKGLVVTTQRATPRWPGDAAGPVGGAKAAARRRSTSPPPLRKERPAPPRATEKPPPPPPWDARSRRRAAEVEAPQVLSVDRSIFEELCARAASAAVAEGRARAVEANRASARQRVAVLEAGQNAQKRALECLINDVDQARRSDERRALELRREAERYRDLLAEALGELVARDARMPDAAACAACAELEDQLRTARRDLAETGEARTALLAVVAAERAHCDRLRSALDGGPRTAESRTAR